LGKETIKKQTEGGRGIRDPHGERKNEARRFGQGGGGASKKRKRKPCFREQIGVSNKAYRQELHRMEPLTAP